MAETVTCTIDGREVTVPAGTRILEAAEEVGIGIAHYCYHPALSAPAMCRMCLVEVEGAPKLQPACITAVADGQVVRTEGALARDAREGVLEFYLANHPLDCPICDKSGECKLQDYVHQEGRKRGRSVEAKRVLGEDFFGGLAGGIVYDGDRCIMCTRCVRFMREIPENDLLCVVQRGNRSVIDTFFEQGLDESAWAHNIIDVCPVGALLAKDFHHKARVWDLDRTPSICSGCSQGCNIDMDVRDNLIQRLRPRENAEVNAYWMCDYGRYDYEWLNRAPTTVGGDPAEAPLAGGPVVGAPMAGAAALMAGAADAHTAGNGGGGEDAIAARTPGGDVDFAGAVGPAPDGSATVRLEAPLVRGDDGVLRPTGWREAILALLGKLQAHGKGGGRVVVSPFAANEDAGLAARLGEVLGGGDALYRSRRAEAEIPCAGVPGLARRRDLAPNVRGLDMMGVERVGDDEGHGGIEASDSGAFIVLGDDLGDLPATFRPGGVFLYLGQRLSPAAARADIALPVTTYAEQDGTFTNHDGRIQRFWAALQAPANARPAWQVLGVLLAGLEDGDAPATAGDAFLRLGEWHAAFRGVRYEDLGTRGALANAVVKVTPDGPELA
jgi:NADH-quinone oxidoreductase subunit G